MVSPAQHHPADDPSKTMAAPGGGQNDRPIFPRAPSLALDHFSDKDFIVRDFIDELAESAIPVNRRSGPAQQAFDPKPLIRTFESVHPSPCLKDLTDRHLDALAQLANLSEELGEKESELMSSVRRAEVQHAQTLNDLASKLDVSMASL